MKTNSKMYYYIKERHNPQLSKPYYVPKGLLSTKDARKMSDSLYGHNNVLLFATVEEYNSKIEQLKADGFNVH